MEKQNELEMNNVETKENRQTEVPLQDKETAREAEKLVEKKEEDEEEEESKKKKILMYDAKPVGVFKLFCTISQRLDVFLMFIGLLGSLGSGVSTPMFAILFGRSLSGYGAEQNAAPDVKVFEKTIGDMVTNFLIVGGCMWVSYFLMTGMWILAGKRQVHRMKELYFRVILKQEQGFFDSNNAYEFSTKVQAQVKQVEGGLGDKVGTSLMLMSQLVTGLVIAFTTSWKLTLVILSTSPIIVTVVALMVHSIKQGSINARKAYEKAGGIAEEVLYNVKTVASFANFDFELQRFNDKINECEQAGIKNGFRLGLGIGWIFFFIYGTYCVAIIYGSKLIVNEEWNSNAGRKFLAGDVITVIVTTIMAVISLGAAAPNAKAIGEACIAASDYFQLNERTPQLDYSTSDKKPAKETLTGRIELKNVSFAYPSKPDLKILKNMDLVFEAGKKIALVGQSGSGKSTIVNLLERLYDSTEGTITIDGMNIRDFDVPYLRSLIGYVQQEPVLFNKSIKENIIFGRDMTGANVDELIKEACEDAHANEFIKKIPEEYEYLVGIKGSKLSGGQKQRVAIARAILTKPKILLLDEATSALDNKSEKEVQRALDTVSQRNVTTIIIAHRLSTVKNADKIYAIKNGEVVEVGTHKELLAKNGYYAGLVKSQLGEEEMAKDLKEEDGEVKENQVILLPNEEMARLKSKELSHFSEDGKPIYVNEIEPVKKVEIDRTKLLALLNDNKCNMFLAAMGSAINGASFPCYGLVISSSINVLSNPNKSLVDSDGLAMGLMFLIIAFFSAMGHFVQKDKFMEIGEVLTAKLRKAVFEKYLRLHMGYFDKNENSPGALLTKLSIDTALLNGLVLTAIGVTSQSLVCLVVGLGLGFSFDWRMALIILCFFPFIIGGVVLQTKLRHGFSASDDKLDIEAGSILSECVINTKTIFSYNFGAKAIEMYLDILSESKANFTKESMYVGLLFGLGQFAIFSALGTLLHSGGRFMIQGDLTFDNMNRAIMCLLFCAVGIGEAQQHSGDFAKAKTSFESLFTILGTDSKISTTEEDNKGKKSAANIKGKIEFKDVVFCYPMRPNVPVLKKVSFTIEPGQSVAFVGFSGSGKSTIVQLIERFYDTQEGQILIDGIDIKEYNLLELRKRIGMVSQEPSLFKRSVKENIHYGNFEADDNDIRIAAEKANITKFFTAKDDGTKDTPVSGGEKQRIAIARAFLKNPKILLLDEATSALDKDSENEVQKALDALQGGRSSITIAHRLSTIEKCDVIYVLELGHIVEQGSHKELYEKKGKYYNLHKLSSEP